MTSPRLQVVFPRLGLAILAIGVAASRSPSEAATPDAAQGLQLHLRTRLETSPGSGRFHTTIRPETWDPARTAIVVCDMWDQHWCRGASERVAQMAPRMNAVLGAARHRGVLIIHCPSDTLKFYAETPQRRLAQDAPPVAGHERLPGWCALAPEREPSLPIDDADGGCDCQPTCPQGSPWRRQIATLEIAPADAITDSAEAFYLMRARGIENVIVMGVHTNMCVLGRPFGIRQLVNLGQRVVLMRDLTDTMYNSRSAPRVNHFTGTDLVVEHIEKYWCPSITSADFLGSPPFRFPADERPHLAMVMAEDEYQTEQTLPAFALAELGRDFRLSLVFGDDASKNTLPGLEVLDEADLALISVRRRILPSAELAPLRRFVAAGKPVVGIRTASHAFAAREGQEVLPGHEPWPEFDHVVFGGNYHGHHGNHPDRGDPPTLVRVRAEAADHPIVAGLGREEFPVSSWLYKTAPLADGAELLMTGRIEGRADATPVTWTFHRADGGRSFYTSLGHPGDLQLADVRRLIVQGIRWAAGLAGRSPASQRAPASAE